MRNCILCGEPFSTMQLHSSSGTITKDDGCAMYEELLLLKEKLPDADKIYYRMCEITENIPIEQLPDHYREIQETLQ